MLQKVSLNEASARDIMDRVAMIGEQKAQAIIDFREANGPFKDFSDVGRVPGFNDKLIESLQIYFTIEEEEEQSQRSKKTRRVNNKEE